MGWVPHGTGRNDVCPVFARYQMPPRKRPKKGGEAAPAAPRAGLRSEARGRAAAAAQDGGTRPATAEAVCSGGVPAIQQAYQAENEAEEARAKAVEAIRTAFVRGAGPAPDDVVQHKLGDRILPVQVEAARFFSIDNWEALKGTWPSNARTSTLIQGACARIKIKCDQTMPSEHFMASCAVTHKSGPFLRSDASLLRHSRSRACCVPSSHSTAFL